MKINEIRDLGTEELEIQVLDLKKELFNLRFQHATNQLDNPQRIGEVKKSIAKIKTVIRERQIAESKTV
ncbi:MAG: 50S ribosomal protein L29 [Clostridia bacterium]|nr:50S ribosomal protein L29 [Clostridia bacterium]